MRTPFIKSILYGWATIFISLVITTFLLALVIRFTSIEENTMSYIIVTVACLILFLGGLIAGLKGKKNALYIGIFTGGGFTLLTFLIQFLGYNELFSLKQAAFHFVYLIIAIIGSMVGVHLIHLRQT